MRAMASNRLCKPETEPGVLRRLETVVMPQMRNEASHDHLRRVLDVVMNWVTGVDTAADRQLLDDTPSMFYALATIRIQGERRVKEDLRGHGLNKRTCGITRQFALWAWCSLRNQRALLEVGYDLANGVGAVER